MNHAENETQHNVASFFHSAQVKAPIVGFPPPLGGFNPTYETCA